MKKGRIFSIFVAFVTSIAFGIMPVSAESISADESLSPVVAEVQNSDGWTSGQFFTDYYTGIKSFKKGTIHITISSNSSPSSTGRYSVTLQKKTGLFSFTDCGTLPVPCNGIITVNFPNQSAGDYRLYFHEPETHIQNYEILNFGSI